MARLLLRTQHQYPPLRASSARRVRDGLPADLRDPCDYPAEALCLVCGQPIRCDRFYLAEWRHIAPERERLERFRVRRNRAACALPCAPIRSLRFRMPCPEGAVELAGGDAQGITTAIPPTLVQSEQQMLPNLGRLLH